ncbi:hypothetical protein SAMN05421788_10760 [Filimonas lacunae]|uniref:YD repeat-containing protein n=1 Tax=Filimonas lacunae TaxID=477680 RepID=A0A173MFK4_9BACT|nr:hypothetical protein [Filimonas lacunae]BAV06404.1 hypothetical protein FLA_2421 [Filimonas lacunae]SIT26822.1 hypothetical protein SAMN05421788_10760 [Filimonas lacunae]
MKKMLLPALLLGAVLTSCSKNDSSTENGPTPYVVKWESNNAQVPGYRSFVYAGDKITSYSDSSKGGLEVYTAVYTGDKLTSIVYKYGSNDTVTIFSFEYDGNGKAIRRNNWFSSDDYMKVYDSIVYNAAGKLIATYTKTVQAGVTNITDVVNYTWDANGNMTQVKRGEYNYNNGVTTYYAKEEYTYDSIANPVLKMGNPVFWFTTLGREYISDHNIVKIAEYDSPNFDDTYVLASVNTYAYTYKDGVIDTRVAKEGDDESTLELDNSFRFLYEYR